MTTTDRRQPDRFEDKLLKGLLEVHAAQLSESGDLASRPVRRQPTLIQRRWAIAAFGVGAAVFGGVAIVSPVVGSDTIVVNAREAVQDPDRVESELQAKGLDAEVWSAPADPSLQDKWLHLYVAPGTHVDPTTFGELQAQVGQVLPSVVDRCGEDLACARTSVLRIPSDISGPIVLIAGRAPQPGEEGWQEMADQNELAPTGAFYCERLPYRHPDEAGQLLEELGYRVQWRYDEGPPLTRGGGVTQTPHEPPAGSRVTTAYFSGLGDTVMVQLAEEQYADEYQRLEGTPGPGSGPPPSWAPPC